MIFVSIMASEDKKNRLIDLKNAYNRLIQTNQEMINQIRNIELENLAINQEIEEIKRKTEQMEAESIQTVSRKLQSIKLVDNSLALQEIIHQNSFKVYIPYYIERKFNSTANCEGCGQQFRVNVKKRHKEFEKEYYTHCGLKCPEYQKLGQTVECKDCKLIFINKTSHSIHRNHFHGRLNSAFRLKEIPEWLCRPVFQKSKSFNAKVQCKGCKKEFPARKHKNNLQNCLDYYQHCIEDCQEYRRLGLITQCNGCGCKFLNRRGHSQHIITCAKN